MKEVSCSTAHRFACRAVSASSGSRRLARSAPILLRPCSKRISTRPRFSVSALQPTSKGSGFRLWLCAMDHAAPPAADTLMEHPGFFERAGPFSLGIVAEAANAKAANGADLDLPIKDVRPLDSARRGDLSFLDNPKYLPLFATTGASACLVAPKFAGKGPTETICLVTPEPYRAFARALALFYPNALNPKAAVEDVAYDRSSVHPSAELEPGATVEPGAVIGPEARIGTATTIAAGTVIGYRVHVGRGCYIGPNASVTTPSSATMSRSMPEWPSARTGLASPWERQGTPRC